MLKELLGKRNFLRVAILSAVVVAFSIILTASVAASPVMATEHLPEPSQKMEISYNCHIEDFGDRGITRAGRTCGTTGQSKRLEAFVIYVNKKPGDEIVQLWYKAWLQGIGATRWYPAGRWIGTKGQSRRLEAFKIQLLGEDADKYVVYYRAHLERKPREAKWQWGWTSWCRDTEWCGTFDQSRRIEAIEVFIADKK